MAIYEARCRQVQQLLAEQGVDALLVWPSSDLIYLQGYPARPRPRLTLLVVPVDEQPIAVVPVLEAMRLDSLPERFFRAIAWEETDDPVQRTVAALGGRGRRAATIAVSDQLWGGFLLRFQAALPSARFVSAGPIMRALRIRKSPDEVELLREAGRRQDRALERLLESSMLGRPEIEVAQRYVDYRRQEGLEVEKLGTFGAGPGGASPHQLVGPRPIQPGDSVVIDGSATYRHYYADSTRTVCAGQSDAELRTIYAVVQEAQEAAVRAVRPGVTAESVDAVAREIIERAGYGDRFIHRTGHGIGLDVHEDPYIVRGNSTVLEPGMAFSIEPGIYLPGRFGVRIEDIVVVTDSGAERLNHLPRELRSVA